MRKGGIASGRDPVLHGAANKVKFLFFLLSRFKTVRFVMTVVAALPCS